MLEMLHEVIRRPRAGAGNPCNFVWEHFADFAGAEGRGVGTPQPFLFVWIREREREASEYDS